MKFRIVFGILATLPLALWADKLFFLPTKYDENSLKTLVFLALGVPILTLNLWAWFYPEIIELYFLGKEKGSESDRQ
jgi:hypothetical protein